MATQNDINVIRCPKCKSEIKLTDAVAAPLLEAQRAQIEHEIRTQATTDAARASADQLQKAADEVVRMRRDLSDQNKKLVEAQTAQADALRKERELETRTRELELTIERRVQASMSEVRIQAAREAADAARLPLAEKEEQLAAMSRQIDDLKRRVEQGSQQLQGEAQEIELEAALRAAFPGDVIEPVAKGVFGGDIYHRVMSPSGKEAGSILWESKRTKNWLGAWLPKLRDDQRAAKADIAVLVTQVMPKEHTAVMGQSGSGEDFVLVDGVWVVLWKQAVPVAAMLRRGILDVALARAGQEGLETKAKTVYRYLTGNTFKARVQAVLEKTDNLKSGLDKERKAMTAIWAGRERDITAVVEQMAGMYGDLQSVCGKGMPVVEGLALSAGGGE